MAVNRFNVRVYGICINDAHQVLLSDEKYGDHYFTKFPGGGLEFGEGTKECVIREWQEELGVAIEVVEHFYTTDYYQQSTFRETDQIISIYYVVKPIDTLTLPVSEHVLPLDKHSYEVQAQRFVPMHLFNAAQLSLPIDKVVVEMILRKWKVE
jgi:8-oxo-dGTP diphosphatase